MSVLPGFGSWINQNVEEPPEVSCKSINQGNRVSKINIEY